MVTPELLRFLFQYNAWADRRVLDACGGLSNEQFTRNLGSSFSSVRDTVAHLYGAEWVWNERFQGHSPAASYPAATFPGLASVRAKLEEMDREILMLREYEELSYAEIAKLLHLGLNTVRSRLFRARLALKNLLAGDLCQ